MTTKGFLPRGDDFFGLTFGNLLFNVFSIRWKVTSNSDFTRYNVFYCIKRHVKNNAFAVCDVKSNNDIPLNREISDKHSIAKPGKFQINPYVKTISISHKRGIISKIGSFWSFSECSISKFSSTKVKELFIETSNIGPFSSFSEC